MVYHKRILLTITSAKRTVASPLLHADKHEMSTVPAFFHEPAHPQTSLQANRYFGQSVRHLFLYQLIGGQWSVELQSVKGVLPSCRKTKLCCAKSSPRYSVSSAI